MLQYDRVAPRERAQGPRLLGKLHWHHQGSELAQIRDYSIKGRLVSQELAARQVFYPLADFASSKKWQNQETESDRTVKLQANKYVSPAAGFGHHGIG